jgi:hypothetical protein
MELAVQARPENTMSDAFDSEETDRMSRALGHALKQLEISGNLDGQGAEAAKAILTAALIEAAAQGERDEHKLAAYALAHFQQQGSQGR